MAVASDLSQIILFCLITWVNSVGGLGGYQADDVTVAPNVIDVNLLI